MRLTTNCTAWSIRQLQRFYELFRFVDGDDESTLASQDQFERLSTTRDQRRLSKQPKAAPIAPTTHLGEREIPCVRLFELAVFERLSNEPAGSVENFEGATFRRLNDAHNDAPKQEQHEGQAGDDNDF